MKTMSSEQRRYNYYCGLPQQFVVQKVVLNYAEGSSSLDEYTEYYNSFTPAQKLFADILIQEIAVETDCALAAEKLGK